MRRYLDALYDAAAYVAAFFMVGTLAMVSLGIVGRMFNWFIAGTDAYAGYCMAAAGFVVWWRRAQRPAVAAPSRFALPAEMNALTVLGLLRRIRERGALEGPQIGELDQTIAELEAHHYGSGNLPGPDLTQTARHWVAVAG